MATPSLLVKASDKKLALQIEKIANNAGYQSVELDLQNKSDKDLASYPTDVFFIQINEQNNTLLDSLLKSHLHFYKDFIFVSQGEPNPTLDELMRQGAGYHFREPVDIEQVKEVLVDFSAELTENNHDIEKIQSSNIDQFGLLTGSSQVMRKLYRTIRRVAGSESNVLIQGESGVGKELVAHTIHSQSKRNLKPFIAVNCGALTPELIDSELFGHLKGSFTGANRDHKGIFEQAQGGTLFLDEVTEMPLEQQVKLLRVLETGEFRPVGSQKVKFADVRIVAATNRNPIQAIETGIFREDLYFRLAQFPLQVPPLRARGNDIIELAKHFLAYRSSEEKLCEVDNDHALEKIASHTWPGNVRELRHTVERAFILAENLIDVDHLIFDSEQQETENAEGVPSGMSLDELEKIAIQQALEDNQGNKTEAAAQLGISVKTLYNKLEKYSAVHQ